MHPLWRIEMNSSIKRGLIIALCAGLLGGGTNYILEGDVAKAFFVTAIGFAIGILIMFIFAVTGRNDGS